MPAHTGNNRGANLDFIGERISNLVKKALADEPERDVDLVRRTLERELTVQIELGSSVSARQLLTQTLGWLTARGTDRAAGVIAPPPEIVMDDDLATEHLAYDEQAAQAFRATPSPDIAFKDLLSSDQMAERLGVSRPTVHRRLRQSDLIGWQSQSGGVVFPAGQLDEFNRPTPNLAPIIAAFVDPQVAWLWLSRPSDLLQDAVPVESLKAARWAPERAQVVIDAAQAKSFGAFS